MIGTVVKDIPEYGLRKGMQVTLYHRSDGGWTFTKHRQTGYLKNEEVDVNPEPEEQHEKPQP